MRFKKLSRQSIESSLQAETRQYLVGNLKNPQKLLHIDDDNIEFGISDYQNENWEDAHSHSNAIEYQYVVKGMTEYMDLESGEIHRFISGDFYVIYPKTRYIQRVKKDTRILFAKYPPGNDKVTEFPESKALTWAKEPLRVERQDSQGQNTLAANSLVPATAAAVLDSSNRILLVRRRDSGKWAMPGGTMEMDESLESCIRREVKEETGINVCIKGIIGTYTDPMTKISYDDGEVRREFSIVFIGYPDTDEVSIDEESTDWKWVPLDQLDTLLFSASQQRRLDDVLKYLEEGKTFIR